MPPTHLVYITNKLYFLIKKELHDLLQYFLFLYVGAIDVQFDAIHNLYMMGGIIQGLATSMLLYGAGKWQIQQEAQKIMLSKHTDFRIEYQVDYVDDGGQLILDKYLKDYIRKYD